jgi:hypothetical protein
LLPPPPPPGIGRLICQINIYTSSMENIMLKANSNAAMTAGQITQHRIFNIWIQ